MPHPTELHPPESQSDLLSKTTPGRLPRYIGEYANVAKCAAACRAEVGCKFFVFNSLDVMDAMDTGALTSGPAQQRCSLCFVW